MKHRIFVTFNLALKLKAKGFPQKAYGSFYNSIGNLFHNVPSYSLYGPYAPTVDEVRVWLIEEKHIKLSVSKKKNFYIHINKMNSIDNDICLKVEKNNELSYRDIWFIGIDTVLDII